LGDNDFRKIFPRFQGEAFYDNLKLVTQVEEIAKRKGVTPGQIALAWIQTLSGSEGMPVMIPIPGASTDKRVLENLASREVKLSEQDMADIDAILKNFTVSGNRYHDHGVKSMNG